MLRRPVFWIALSLVAVLSAAAAYQGFPSAFSIVSIDISMTRDRALTDARAIAARDHFGPENYREATSFSLDEDTQTFVELEGGGKEAFTAMMRDGLYQAYTWRVRHFRETEANETTTSFAPDGRPYGFVEKIKEDTPGAALDPDAARVSAEQGASARWNIDLSQFRLVEHAQERRQVGRVDHTFTYERPAPTVGEGRYRLRLVVSGDRLTEVTHFVKVPEAFSRRYASLRSANTTLGLVSVVGMLVLYGVGGMGVGLFVMMRLRWILARPAAVWGIAVAGLQTLVSVNEWPLVWMSYDTATPRTLFFTGQLVGLASTFIGFSLIYTVSFMTAETLTRRAFGSHPQLWRSWSRGPGSSVEILGRTAGAYLLVALFFAYDVLLYEFATKRLGWWVPSEALFHPDVLAAYVPWFSAIGSSLQAGFWEECLFRAVPIAGAALIGDRFGRRKLAIVIAFVIQAIVFGTGHAPYANQPFFARPVELVIPSIGFGLLYLYFGLVPGIILHFIFDTTWFALPLFVAHTPGIWIQRAMVVLVALVPLWVVLWRRVQAGRWTSLDPADRNAGWTPPAPVVRAAPEPRVAATHTVGAGLERLWLVLGAIALVVSIGGAILHRDGQRIDISRAQAIDIARRALEARGVTLGPTWQFLAQPDDGSGGPHEFVSETAGEARRQALMGSYLSKARWAVRVVTFEGDVAQRAEEWQVFVTASGEARPIIHQLPEARPGASLDEAPARQRAVAAIADRLKLDAAKGEVREISATPQKLPARTDWTFIFTDTTVPPLPKGEPRIRVEVAGDEVAAVGRSMFVPEDWERQASATGTRNAILQAAVAIIPAGLLVTLAIRGLVLWSRRRFSPRLFLLALAQVAILAFAGMANNWPGVQAGLSTAQPYMVQVGTVIAVTIVGVLLSSAVVALVMGAVPPALSETGRLPDRTALGLGLAAGAIGSALLLAASWLKTPVWAHAPAIAPIGTFLPIVSVLTSPIGGMITRVALVVSLLASTDQFTGGWTRRRLWASVELVLVGLAVAGAPDGSALGGWFAAAAIGGFGFAAMSMLLLRLDITMVPLAFGVIVAIDVAQTGLQRAYPGALAYALVAAVAVLLVAWWWFRIIRASARSSGLHASPAVPAGSTQ